MSERHYANPIPLAAIYARLRQHFGQHPAWWPIFGDNASYEIVVGAVLVQQTRWEAVEAAVLRLHAAGLRQPAALAASDADTLAGLLRGVAFYRQKARGLIAISQYLVQHYAGSMAQMLAQPTAPLRRELLALPRIGPETADVVLLYAGGHAVFVIDDYTRRLFARVQPALPPDAAGLDWVRARYERLRALCEHAVAPAVYADYHAQITEQCVRYCLARRPRCDGPPARRVYSQQAGRAAFLERGDGCPLRSVCAFYQAAQVAQVAQVAQAADGSGS